MEQYHVFYKVDVNFNFSLTYHIVPTWIYAESLLYLCNLCSTFRHGYITIEGNIHHLCQKLSMFITISINIC